MATHNKSAIMPRSVFKLEHDGATPFPLIVLREIVCTLGYDPFDSRSGPDGKSDHRRATGLERTAFMVLGKNIFEWHKQLSARDSGYNNTELAEKIDICYRFFLDYE
jgi:hypothetical protein